MRRFQAVSDRSKRRPFFGGPAGASSITSIEPRPKGLQLHKGHYVACMAEQQKEA